MPRAAGVSLALCLLVASGCRGVGRADSVDAGAEGGTDLAVIDAACSAYANAYCAELGKCQPDELMTRYGGEGACQSGIQQLCASELQAPYTGKDPAQVQACASVYITATCNDLYLRQLPPACGDVAGGRAAGDVCAFDSQCQSGYCEATYGPGSPGGQCGRCTSRPGAGDACNPAMGIDPCPAGLFCRPDVNAFQPGQENCLPPIAAGGACEGPCVPGAECALAGSSSKCQAYVSQAGAPCDPWKGPPCDTAAGLWCDPSSNTCKPVVYLQPGSSCMGGLPDGQECMASSSCVSTAAVGLDGVCATVSMTGGPCETDPTRGTPFCAAPASCLPTHVCALPDGAYCDVHASEVAPLPGPMPALIVPAGASVVASGLADVSGVGVDATSVYAFAYNGVLRIPKSGGIPVVLTPTHASGSIEVPVDAANVYFASTSPAIGSVYAIPIGGGTATLLAQTSNDPADLAIDGTSIYFSVPDGTSPGALQRAPLGGGTVTTLTATGSSPTGIAVDGTSVYFIDSDGPPYKTYALMKVPIAGGTLVTLATGPTSQNTNLSPPIATDGQNVYWAVGNAILKIPVGGGTPVTLGTDPNLSPMLLRVDNGTIYYSTDFSVGKLPVQGGPVVTLISDNVNGVWGLAVDATSVYWATGNGQTNDADVLKAPK